MRFKFIATMASVAALGLAASGCVSEGGYHHDSYRPAVIHHTDHQARDHANRGHRDTRRSSRDRHGHTSTHRARDNHGWNDHGKCRPGSKDCRRHK
jgi:hypothetical protein